MTGSSVTPLVLNELPIPEDRDLAWRLLAERGCTVQLDNDLAMTCQRTAEGGMRPLPLVPLASDPPEQTRYRRILQPFFSPRSIRPLEERLRAHIVSLIEPIAQRGSCEFGSEIADIFPVQTFLAFFGLPASDLADFMVWKEAILEGSD